MKTLLMQSAGMLIILMLFGSCEHESAQSREQEDFLESVAILQHGLSSDLKYLCSDEEYPLTVELIDFSENIVLRPAYIIDNVEYCDNGLFNDVKAYDGIYTSVEKFSPEDSDTKKSTGEELTILLNKSENFKYEKELEDYLSYKKALLKIYIKIGCKFRTAPCPETSWWNECWFTDGPCTCIEFYDCELTVGVESKI